MLNREFIPYEQALALKELGFDEPCFATYNTDKKVSRNPSHNMEDLPIEGQPYYWQNSKIHITCITAPLYQQAFRWFREKGLHSAIMVKITPSNTIVYYVYEGKPKKDWNNCFKTYEEAELECLKKLIEIVKQK